MSDIFRTFSVGRVQQAEKNFQSLSKSQQDLIPSFLDHLDIVRACIDHNYEIIKLIIKDAETVFENKKQEDILVRFITKTCPCYLQRFSSFS